MIEFLIRFTFGASQTDEIAINLNVPSIGCLLETIQCSLESAHMRLIIKSLEALWLIDIYLLLNNSIKGCCFHNHLDLPPHMCN